MVTLAQHAAEEKKRRGARRWCVCVGLTLVGGSALLLLALRDRLPVSDAQEHSPDKVVVLGLEGGLTATVRMSEFTPQNVMKAIATATYQAGQYASIAGGSPSLWDDEAPEGQIRARDLDDRELLDLYVLAHLKVGDLQGASCWLHRQQQLAPRDSASYYKLALVYLGREMLLPARYLLQEASSQPVGSAAVEAARQLLGSLPSPPEAGLADAEQLITFAYEDETLRNDLIAAPRQALEDRGIRLRGEALQCVLAHDFSQSTSPCATPTEQATLMSSLNSYAKELLRRIESRKEAGRLQATGADLAQVPEW